MELFTREAYEAFILTLPGTKIVEQWDSHVAKVGDKVFSLLTQDRCKWLPKEDKPYRFIVIHCPGYSFEMLTTLSGVNQASHFAKRRWASISNNSELSEDDIKAYITRSHQLIAAKLTKKLRAELGITI
ncbi:MmcQ/YjbR family DNA-binding protein [Microvirga sp. W0021]|uniref:MmcQ/YjbR family DNA-binding protein n=1 Tax=Hohaiivirga grylli TaxID=3133970 RepID=A0ABV0BH29_9HYPH